MQEMNLDQTRLCQADQAASLTVIDCQFLNIVLTDRPVDLPSGFWEDHPLFEFLIPLSPIPRFQVGDRELNCLPGCLLPIAPGTRHGVLNGCQGVSLIQIFVGRDYLDRLSGQMGSPRSLAEFVSDALPLQPDIQHMIDRLIQEYRGSAAGREVLMSSLAQVLVILLIRHYSQPAAQPEIADPGRLKDEQFRFQKVLSFMQEHYCMHMSIDKLASQCGMNSFHFIRSFKKQFAVSPYNYLTCIRITNAKRLLIRTNLSVAQIGRQCGFPSASRFSAVFLKDTGLTPTRFRRSRKAP